MHYNSLRLGKTIWKKKKFLDRFWEFYHFIIIKMLIGNFILSFFFTLTLNDLEPKFEVSWLVATVVVSFLLSSVILLKALKAGYSCRRACITSSKQSLNMYTCQLKNIITRRNILYSKSEISCKKKNVPFCLAQHVKWIWKGPEKKYVYSIFCFNTNRR